MPAITPSAILTLSLLLYALPAWPFADPATRPDPLVPAPTLASPQQWVSTLKDFHPYAWVDFGFDSNLLRRPDGADASDRYLTRTIGFATELRLSRQRVLLDGRVYHTSYDRFGELDHTGGDARVAWRWVYGEGWEGELGYTFRRKQKDFANQLIPTDDLQDRQRFYLEARRMLTSRWRLGGAIDWTDIAFTESEITDKTLLGLGARLDYLSKAGNTAGLAVSYTQAHFKHRDDGDYTDLAIGPSIEWRLSGKTRVHATAGYKSRRYDDLAGNDFDGPVGRLVAVWEPTGKTSVKLALWRDLTQLDDEVADYAVVDGVSLAPRWDITAKTSLLGVASLECRDFQGGEEDPPMGIAGDRIDEVARLGLTLEWRPRPTIALSLGVHAEHRDSTRATRDYTAQWLMLGAKIGL